MEVFESIVCPTSDENPRNSEASLVELADGRLFLAWSDFYGGPDDFGEARISAKISGDKGRTWGSKFTLRENIGQMNVFPPGLIRLRSGEIGLSYCIKDSARSLRPHFIRTADEGATWTDPVCIVQGPGYFELDNDRLIQTRDGTLMAPMSGHWMSWPRESTSSRSAICPTTRASLGDGVGGRWKYPALGRMSPLSSNSPMVAS